MWLSRISQGEGKFGPMEVEHNVCSRWSIEVLMLVQLLRRFYGSNLFLYKPFDLGYKGDEVMWSMACDVKNCEKGSDEKGGPLSEEICWGLPNCEKRSCK